MPAAGDLADPVPGQARRFYADPAIVRATVFPRRADLSIERVDFYMQAIESAGMVTIFEADGQRWQCWPRFADNQVDLRDDREATDFPPPPADAPDKPVKRAGKYPESIRKASLTITVLR